MKPENPKCEVCNEETDFFQDVPDVLGVSCCFRCPKCGFIQYIQHLKEWIH